MHRLLLLNYLILIQTGFTFISYLYNGLSEEKISEILLKVKSFPKEEFLAIMGSFCKLQTNISESDYSKLINSFDKFDISDHEHISAFTKIYNHNFKVICFYLNHFVFPEGTKQFKFKITGNACTLVKNTGTVGFSGTDDKKVTMPIFVKSKSYDETSNGKMLHILSREINQKYKTIDITKTSQNPQHVILNEICGFTKKPENKNTSILIDSGALLTNITNKSVAEYLLANLDKKFQGCVYFDDSTAKIQVLLRNYNAAIDYVNCHLLKEQLFTYLDDAHTRGTDLKFPPTANGIVTIGNDMNKDKLMQACMRMRQLNSMQSVSIFGTREMSLTIASLLNIDDISKITTFHVINWVTYNTIVKIKKDLFHVVLQNVRSIFKRRALFYQQNCNIPIPILIENCKDPIIVSLETLYVNSTQKTDPRRHLHMIVESMKAVFWNSFERNVKNYETSMITNIDVKNSIREDRLKDDTLIKQIEDDVKDKYGRFEEIDVPRVMKVTNNGSFEFSRNAIDSSQEVQMEIEVMHKNEIPLPLIVDPKQEKHWNFNLIYSPKFYKKNSFIKPLKECFTDADKLIQSIDQIEWSQNVYATDNFFETITDKNRLFEYMRPVQFILMCRSNVNPVAVLLSGFEAEKIIECLKNKNDASLVVCHLKASNNEIINVSTSFPNKIEFTQEEKNMLTVIKLFNGECEDYNDDEIKYLKKLFLKLDELYFLDQERGIDKIKSKCFYVALKTKGYLSDNGFFTHKMCASFSYEREIFELSDIDIDSLCQNYLKQLIYLDNNKKNSLDQCLEFIAIFLLNLNQAVKRGICTYNTKKQVKGLIFHKLPNIMKKVVEMHGRTKEYEGSKLKRYIFEE